MPRRLPDAGFGTAALDRRSFLRAALVSVTSAVAGAGRIGCTSAPSPRPQPTETGTTVRRNKVLLAYFSRAGENYYYGGRRQLTVGNTEMLANLISQRIDCDV